MNSIDCLINAKRLIASSEVKERDGDDLGASADAHMAVSYLQEWEGQCYESAMQKRRNKGLADTTEVMAEAYRHEHRQ